MTVPPNVRPLLVAHLAEFVGPQRGAWLFTTEAGNQLTPRTFDRVWERARKAAGCPDIHLHDLRHSGLTWYASMGATVAELQRRGGHASPAAALRYQHASPERDAALADAMSQLAVPAPTVIPAITRDVPGSLTPG